ncbi:MAG: RNA 2',3'-cyclic phosphodiesterase [Lachnospiraceae bacterium]|nr:RNA 2',3'-cyclic phosphodiesterase [Lachnospiraceae bacterium]
MRLFIAIQLSDEMKSSVIGLMHELKKAGIKGSYVPAQNLHLTLAFIGEVSDPDMIEEAMRTVKVKPFRLSLSEMGSFGDLLWVGLRGNQGLSLLVKAIREALDAAGTDYDRKSFTPHITIIRKASKSTQWQKLQVPKSEMMVKKVSLMRSEQRDGKRIYTEIFAI